MYIQLAITDTCVKRTLVQWGQLIPVSLTWICSYELLSNQDTCLIRTVQGRHLTVLIRQVVYIYIHVYIYMYLFFRHCGLQDGSVTW